MDVQDMMNTLYKKIIQYSTMRGVKVVDENGKEITSIIFEIEKNNRIIIK